MKTLEDVMSGGYSTEELDRELRELFATNPKLIAKVERTLETVEEEKRELFRSLLIDNYICDLILLSHYREGL